jgi:hypothetical protein
MIPQTRYPYLPKPTPVTAGTGFRRDNIDSVHNCEGASILRDIGGARTLSLCNGFWSHGRGYLIEDH